MDPVHGLKDVDLVYFDDRESESDQAKSQAHVSHALSGLKLPVDVKNQALVHTWYSKKFGYDIQPYRSTEDGIRTWLPAFAIGVRPIVNGLIVFAPYGLSDLFEMVIRPNEMQITEAIYSNMVTKFKARWPSVTVVEWEDDAE